MVSRICASRTQTHDERSALTLHAEVRRWNNMYSRRGELAYRRMIFYQIDEITQDIGKTLLSRTKHKSFDKFS